MSSYYPLIVSNINVFVYVYAHTIFIWHNMGPSSAITQKLQNISSFLTC